MDKQTVIQDDDVKRTNFYNSVEFKASIAQLLAESKDYKDCKQDDLLLETTLDDDTEDSEMELREEPFGDLYKIIFGVTELTENKVFTYKNSKGYVKLYLFPKPFLGANYISFPFNNPLINNLKDVLDDLPNTIKKITFKQLYFSDINFDENPLWKTNQALFNNIPSSLEKINVSILKIANGNLYNYPINIKADEVKQTFDKCIDAFKSLWRIPYGTVVNIKKINAVITY